MKITGIPVSTTVLRPDWHQSDPSKTDYIKNKPNMDEDKASVQVITWEADD